MVHQETLCAAFVEIRACLPEEGIDTEFEVEFVGPQLVRILGEGRFTSVSLALPLAGTLFTTLWVVGGIALVVIPSFAGEVAEEFACFSTDGVDTGGPDLDAAVEGAGGTLEVDRVIVVVAEKGHVVEVVDEGEVPGVCGIDFLKSM